MWRLRAGGDVPHALGRPGGHRPTLLRGSAAIVWLDVALANGGKPSGSASLRGRAFARKNGPRPKIATVARSQAPRFVARRIASLSTTPAPVGAPPPLIFRGENCSHLGLVEPRDCDSMAV